MSCDHARHPGQQKKQFLLAPIYFRRGIVQNNNGTSAVLRGYGGVVIFEWYLPGIIHLQSRCLHLVHCVLAFSAGISTHVHGARWKSWHLHGNFLHFCFCRPKQQLYKTVNVSGAKDVGAACCSICASEAKCVEWMAISAEHSGYKAGTCFLNNHTVFGTAPASPVCTSGGPGLWNKTAEHVHTFEAKNIYPYAAPAPLPPTPKPKPPPAGAKNVLFFAGKRFLRQKQKIFILPCDM